MGDHPPEHLSMAASAAMYVLDRTDGFSRQDIRDHLDDLEPDHLIAQHDIDELRRMAR